MAESIDIKKEHVCDECGKSFDKAIALAGHRRSHFKEKDTDPEFEIFIHDQEGEPSQVFLRMTGKDTPNKSWIVKRGEWVKVPKHVITILRGTIVETTEYIPDETIPGKYLKRPVSYMRYPFSERIATA